MRAAIRPAFLPGISGGIEPYVQGLALGLGALEGEDRFDFVGTPAQRSSLAPFISGPAQWVELPTLPMTSSPGIRRLVHRAHLAGLARRVRGSALRLTQRRGQEMVNRRLPRAPDTVELGPYDVVHFAAQAGEVTKLPTIYQPWDVQHLHYPEFFSRDALEQRAAVWEPCSQRARYVLVASDFVRRDVIDAFGIEPERVAVVHPGSPLSTAVARVESTRPFALFPAQTWKHKNHARLIDALAILRSRGTDVTVVCPGQPNVRDREVKRHARVRGVTDLVRFPGFVSPEELAVLFSTARCLLFPSLFEGFGFPVLEAFVAGLPVACSNTTSLPEVAGDAAVLFDPTDVEAIADAIERMWTDDSLRATLAERGIVRAQLYTWDNLARSCRALYRAAAEVTLTAEDTELLGAAGVAG